MKNNILVFLLNIFFSSNCFAKDDILVGVYFFGGWSGVNTDIRLKAINAPMHLTYKLFTDFSNRKPIWGWRDDDVKLMEKQIDLASNSGVDFFTFCWYWYDDNDSIKIKKIEESPLNQCIELFLKAKNCKKLKFSILVANHNGYRINGSSFEKCISYLSEKYFSKSNYLLLNNKPVIEFFDSESPIPYISKIRKKTIENCSTDLYIISKGVINENYDAVSWYNIAEGGTVGEYRPYSSLNRYVMKKWNSIPSSITVFPLCMTGWDRRPWFKNGSFIYYKRPSGKEFYKQLNSAKAFLNARKYTPAVIMIYAWNEYGEGGYMTPTNGDKAGSLLKQVKRFKKLTNEKAGIF